jgi:hypothetical protein
MPSPTNVDPVPNPFDRTEHLETVCPKCATPFRWAFSAVQGGFEASDITCPSCGHTFDRWQAV